MLIKEVPNLLEIVLKQEDDFLKIKETLTRMGILSEKNRTLYQTCHILHKRGRYYIVHFKEMFMLDGRPSDMSKEDYARRDSIALALQEWGMCEFPDNVQFSGYPQGIGRFRVIKHSDKNNWKLQPKYRIGIKKF